MEKTFPGRLLVPIDESETADMVVDTAINIAKKTGARVTVLNVISRSLPYGEDESQYQYPDSVTKEIMGSMDQRAEALVGDVKTRFVKEGINAETDTLRAVDAGKILVEYSENTDLIVMGGKGVNQDDPRALGRVAKKVVTDAKCPTLVVKRLCGITDVLVSVDDTPHSARALNYALELARKMSSRVTLLTVQEHRTAGHESDNVFNHLLKDVEAGKVEIQRKTEFGKLPDTIVETAEKGNHDLVIVGRHGLGRLSKTLRGSVSLAVSQKAACSVLVVP